MVCLMKTYVNIIYSSEGPDPVEVIEAMESIGAKAIVGPWDFEVESDKESLLALLRQIHSVLKGKNVHYQVTSVKKGFTSETDILR